MFTGDSINPTFTQGGFLTNGTDRESRGLLTKSMISFHHQTSKTLLKNFCCFLKSAENQHNLKCRKPGQMVTLNIVEA